MNNLKFTNVETRITYTIQELDKDLDIRNAMFDVLNLKGKMTVTEVMKSVLEKPKEWEAKNFKDIEGNNTNKQLYEVYFKIIELSGHEAPKTNEKEYVSEIFEMLGINPGILEFNNELEEKEFELQPAYQLWHLLYAYEGDDSETGNETLIRLLDDKFGFEREYAKLLANIAFQDDYGSLSSKAIKKIMPYLKAGHEYSEAAEMAGYRHSHAITKEENEKRQLEEYLELLPKNSLRNPVVEKILNQMVNVVNAIIKEYGKPDEIRVELARELKKSAKERKDMTSHINAATIEHERIKKQLKELPPFNKGVRITRNDIIKYKLYLELSSIGYKTIYTNTYIPEEKLFSKEFDIEHIIPKALLFDDSFSNKTLATRDFNRVKSNKTGIQAIIEKYGENSEGYNKYIENIEKLFDKGKGKLSKAKYNKLLMNEDEIPEGFIERDLRNSQYIAKKAQEMLRKVVRIVTSTTGSITDKLREDWQLINVLQELNWEKYEKLGLTGYEINKEGNKIPVIKGWTKRSDHRHHAMDALTVAFTKYSHVQYFNYLNARRDETNKKHGNIIAIEHIETFVNDKGKRLIKPPIPIEQFRAEAKKHLEGTLVSFKAKNKVVTRNKNKTKKKAGYNEKIEITPRGQLHKETVYGTAHRYFTNEESVGVKFDVEKIQRVAKKSHREALMKRLEEFDMEPKKAFGGKNAINKNPVFLDEHQSEKIPGKVKLVEMEQYHTIRKDITPDNFKTEKNIEKVIDVGVRRKLLERLRECEGDEKKAFANLEENPIWLNEEKGICIKSTTITGVNNAEPLHVKKDNMGKEILDNNGQPIPVDFVSTGNNHHVAIYKDEEGNFQEDVVSLYDAVARVNAGTPVVWQKHPEHPDWAFQFTMKQNEYFVFPNKETGFDPVEIDLLDEDNYALISLNLFRVQKFSKLQYGNSFVREYVFRHHLETQLNDDKRLKGSAFIVYKSAEPLKEIVKVRINHIGKIIKVGE